MSWDTLSNTISKFAPILFYDDQEQCLPSSVDWYFPFVGYQKAGGDLLPPGSWTWSSVPCGSDDYLVVPDQNAGTVAPGNFASAVAYVHVLPVTGQPDQIDIQYWMFYPQNGKTTFRVDSTIGLDKEAPLGLSIHWGDWEFVTVRVNSSQKIVAVFLSEHSDGQWVAANGGVSFDGSHPKVYVARGSHANYPGAGGPFEIGGYDVLSARWSEVDYADGKGKKLDLSQAGKLVLISNDAQTQFPSGPAPAVLPWMTFPGQWGQTLANQITPTEMVNALIGALQSYWWAAPLLPLLGAIAGTGALAASIGGTLFDAFFNVSQNGPVGPTFHSTWSRTPEFLPFGNDELVRTLQYPLAATSAPVALVSQTGSDLLCFNVLNATTIAAGVLESNDTWVQASSGLPGVQSDSGLGAIATATLGQIALLSTRNDRLVCVLSSNGAAGPWQQPAGWPVLASTTAPSVCKVSAIYYITYGGGDGALHFVTTTDWQQFSAEQTVMVLDQKAESPEPSPVQVPNGMGFSPAVAACGTSILVVTPLVNPVPGLPPTLGAFLSSDGTTWSGPYLSPDSIPYANTGGSLVSASDGRVYCFFADAGKNVRFCSTSDGIGWTHAGKVAGAYTSRTPTAIQLASGFVYVHPGKKQPQLWWNIASV